MRWKASFRTKLALAFLGLSVLTAATVLHLAWSRARAAQLEGLRGLLRSVSGSIAPEIDGDRHAALAARPSAQIPSDPAYAELAALGARVLASHPGFHEVFTVSLEPGGSGAKILYATDPAEAGRPYDMSRFPAMERARTAPDADEDVCPDEYGVTLSGYAAIRARNGATVGLIGIDMDASTVDAMRGRLLGILAGGAGGAVILGAALALLFARRIHRPVLALSAGMNRVAAGDFSARVDWPSGDEFERLAGQFNTMAAGLDERRRLKHALEIAMEIQQSLLPSSPPEADGVDVAGFSDYCDETGGDYFDYPFTRARADGTLALTIGDVTGHGVGAALLMASGRAALRSQTERLDGPGQVVGVVNRRLAHDASAGKFMTLFYGVLDPRKGTLAYSNAGQGGCFVVRNASRTVELLEASGPPAGVIESMTFDEATIEGLLPGDVVVLGTDGIWETLDASGEAFGMARFEEVARDHAEQDAHGIADSIRRAVETFRGDAPQGDDVTLIVAKLDPSKRAPIESS